MIVRRLGCFLLLLLLLSFVVLVVAQEEEVGDAAADDNDEKKGDPFSTDQPCVPHRCADGYELLPVWPIDYTSGGCNAMSGLVNVKYSPNAKDNDPMNGCCNMRTACYQVCGMPKRYCDETFDKCGQTACDGHPHPEGCQKTTSLHLMLGKMGNCDLFRKAQHENCRCVPFPDATKERTKFLRKFYTTHNPDSVHKVQGIVAKTETSTKFAAVLFKLVQKFNLVRRVSEDDDKMEKFRREGRDKFEKEQRAKFAKQNRTDDDDDDDDDEL